MSYKTCQNPIFIIGCPRSGTSVVREALRRHTQVFVPVEETNFVYRIWGNRKAIRIALRELNEQKVFYVLDRWAVADVFRDPPQWGGVPLSILTGEIVRALETNGYNEDIGTRIFSLAMEAAMNRQEKSLWGEKTPEHVYVLPILLHLFPRARFVHLLRDGRAVTASLCTRAAITSLRGMLYAACRWKHALKTVESFKVGHPEAKILDIRFEDLVEKPRIVLDKLCRFLAIPFEEEMLEFQYSNSAYESDRQSARNVTGIHMVDQQRWQRVFCSQWQIALQQFLQRELTYLDWAGESDRWYPEEHLWQVKLVGSSIWMKYLLRINTKILIARTGYAWLFRRLLGLDPRF